MVHGVVWQRVRAGCAAAAALLAVCGAPQPAWAQPAGGAVASPDAAGPEAQRTELYRQASEAAAAGRWTEARDKLRAAVAIRSSPKVLFSLAQAEEQLGQVASAQADYGRALEGAKAAGEGEVVAAAGQAVAAIAARVPYVRVVVTGGSPGAGIEQRASATLDGQPVAVGTPVVVDPGAHRVVVSAPGMRQVATSVAISERQQLDVPVRLQAAEALGGAPAEPAPTAPAPVAVPLPPAAPAEPAPSAGDGAGPWRTVGLVLAAAGVVGLGVGAAFGVESMSKHGDAQKACPGATCPDAAGASLWHDAVTAGNASTVAFVVGGVVLAGGAVLWLAAPRSQDTGPQVGLGPGSVQLRGAW